MKKKFFTKKKVIILVVVVIILAILITRCQGGTQSVYQEVTAEKRDITTYLEFSGNVEAVDVANVYAATSAKISEIMVEEGDEVKAGDVIALLDSRDVDYNIQLREASLELAKLQDSYNIKDSQTNLDNLQTQIESGTNSSLNNAQKSLLSAQDQYYTAAQNYNTAVSDYNTAKADYEADRTSTIVSAKQQLQSAQTSLSTQEYNVRDMPQEDQDYSLLSAKQQVQTAQENLNTARENAKDAVEDLKTAADHAEESLKRAENALQDAERDYETAVASVDQSIQSNEDALEKVQALTSQETSEMELAHLRETLGDYVITAPIDGFVTTLSIKEGENTSLASPALVITNFETMEVSINIDEYDIADVHEGDSVEIYVNALDTYYDGVISSISKTATVQSDVSYLKATVEFETDEDISSGLSAEIKLIKLDEKDVTALPISAIEYDTDNTAYVMLKGADGNGVRQNVTLGVSDGNYVQILEGIQEGDVVLVTPSLADFQMMMGPGAMTVSGS